MNDGPDGQIYCKACYGHKFGVRGVGFGIGGGALNMVRGTNAKFQTNLSSGESFLTFNWRKENMKQQNAAAVPDSEAAVNGAQLV